MSKEALLNGVTSVLELLGSTATHTSSRIQLGIWNRKVSVQKL
jgi:hypothetical protein